MHASARTVQLPCSVRMPRCSVVACVPPTTRGAADHAQALLHMHRGECSAPQRQPPLAAAPAPHHTVNLTGPRRCGDVTAAGVQVASITENQGGNQYAYRCSKIAANMATKSMSIDLLPRGITSTILHPGYVRTDMTGGAGLIDVDESVRGMLDVLESGIELNGQWYHTSGRHLPW